MKTKNKVSVGAIRFVSRKDSSLTKLYCQLNEWLYFSGWDLFLDLEFEQVDTGMTERIEFIQGEFQSNPSLSYVHWDNQQALSFAKTWIEGLINNH